MTWILKVQYVNESKPWKELHLSANLSDEIVEDSVLGIREAYFALMLKELDRKIKNENT
jgi:hypothetical protein